MSELDLIRGRIRDVPDFPKPGIMFRDITPVLADPDAFSATIDLLCDAANDMRPDQLLAIESRGFIFAAPMALRLGLPLQLVRKPGKLPGAVDEHSYTLEYGTSTLQIRQGVLGAGDRVVIVDDLLATGGTAAAAAVLVGRQGATVAGFLFVVELAALGGRKQLGDWPCAALLSL